MMLNILFEPETPMAALMQLVGCEHSSGAAHRRCHRLSAIDTPAAPPPPPAASGPMSPASQSMLRL
jgi:hypothetical protein